LARKYINWGLYELSNLIWSAHSILLKDLEPFPQQKMHHKLIAVLQAHNPPFLHEINTLMVVLKNNMVGALFPTPNSSLAAQNQHVKTIPKRHLNFLFFSCNIDSHISQKVVVLIPCCHKLVRILFPPTTLTSI
jgi:hypothetical protein